MNATKTMTVEQFQALLGREDWTRKQYIEQIDTASRQEWEEDDVVDINVIQGYAMVESALDGVTIEYQESWNYDEFEPDTFSTSTEGLDDVWAITGVTVLDEDGEPLSQWDVAMLLPREFSYVDYSGLKAGIEQVTDIDTDTEEDSAMETITLPSDNAPSIRFKGERIARTSSSPDTANSYYSGTTGRFTILELYRTASGKYVCHSVGVTQWQGEHDRYKTAVCETVEGVINFFGHGWLAKDLYSDAGIEDVTDIE